MTEKLCLSIYTKFKQKNFFSLICIYTKKARFNSHMVSAVNNNNNNMLKDMLSHCFKI